MYYNSDSPNLHTSFLSSLNEERMDRELSHLVLLGSCGLHTIHNSFKHGENATGWNFKVLRFLKYVPCLTNSMRARQDLLTKKCWQKLKIPTIQFHLVVTDG